jgi:hypothetical protein
MNLLQHHIRRFQAFSPTALATVALIAASGPSMAQFTEVDPGVAEPPFSCVAPGDYDGDGAVDLLVAGSGHQDIAFTTIYRNVNGSYVDSGLSLLGLARATAAFGDFDQDGDLDLAMTGLTTAGAATTRIYRNNGGTFSVVSGSFLGVFGGSVAWGDYDGDGDLDLLVTGIVSPTAGAAVSTRLYRNDAGAFVSVPHPFQDCYVGSAAWGDFDGDGDQDLVLCGSEASGALTAVLWRNNGGTFTDAGANLPGTDLGFATWGDYDHDGDLDLLFGGNSNAGFISRVYRNDAGTLNDANVGLVGVIWSAAAWGDYDHDGDLDAMVIGYEPVAQIPRSILYRNDAGTFVNTGVAFHDLYLGSVNWLDYDRDGDLDLVLAGNDAGNDIIRLARNDLVAGALFCFGDGSGTACPCANAGATGNGCANSSNAGGAHLAGIGLHSITADTLLLTGAGMPNGGTLYFQGTARVALGAGSVFGDGLLCAGGALVRLGAKINANGSSQFPAGLDPSISTLGAVFAPGTRTYQAWYRDAVNFCSAATYNLTNAIEVRWTP